MMEVFESVQREKLYGVERQLIGEQMKNTLTRDSVLKDGEYNMLTSKLPVSWSSWTKDDYRTKFKPTAVGKQYSEDYKKETGSCIPIKQEGVPIDSYILTTTREDYINKGTDAKREYIGNERTTNWPDMNPLFIDGKKLEKSEYTDLYLNKDLPANPPAFPKINTTKVKLPLPIDERKNKVNVSLGANDAYHGLASESTANYRQTNPQPYDSSLIKQMKRETEWNSKVFKEGDYNGTEDIHHSVTDIDFGKKIKADKSVEDKRPWSERMDTKIEHMLHYVPSLIENSMSGNTAAQDGADRKTYHTKAHFLLGQHPSDGNSMYYKDFTIKSDSKPEMKAAVRPRDSHVVYSDSVNRFNTNNRSDYVKTTAGLELNSNIKSTREANMKKQNSNHINFQNMQDQAAGFNTVFRRDFQAPPRGSRRLSAAKEKKCEFDFLESNAGLESFTRALPDKTEASSNFTSAKGAVVLNETGRARSAVKRRLKSGRRGHFILGNSPPSYKTETVETYEGKRREDDNIPAAGKVETKANEYNHLADNDREHEPVNFTTIMKSDYTPAKDRNLSEYDRRQITAEHEKHNKPLSDSHYFHLDTTNRNQYETTVMATYIKPEQMSGKVHLSKLQ